MRVLLLSKHADTAGQQAALRAALAVHRPAWVVDQMRRHDSPYGYPVQHAWDPALARQLWAQADVVHLDVSYVAARQLGQPGVPLVVHHHGSEYRDEKSRAWFDWRCRAMTQVVSTVDLLGSRGVEWLPVVADLDALARLRATTYRRGRRLRVATSPTDPGLKGTAAVVAASQALAGRYPHDLDVISGVGWQECLARKAQADVFVDQLELGYGLSAVEAWAMGIPVVAGVRSASTRRLMRRLWGALPFPDASGALETALELLLASASERRAWAVMGQAHVWRFHSQQAVVDRLDAVYQQAMHRRRVA